MKTKTKITKEEEKGIKMIQFLQKMGGVNEPRGRALNNWRAFSDWEKRNTEAAYTLFGGGKNDSKPTRPKTTRTRN